MTPGAAICNWTRFLGRWLRCDFWCLLPARSRNERVKRKKGQPSKLKAKRRRFEPALKARIGWEALKGIKMGAQIARPQAGLPTTSARGRARWRTACPKGSRAVPAAQVQEREAEIERLERKGGNRPGSGTGSKTSPDNGACEGAPESSGNATTEHPTTEYRPWNTRKADRGVGRGFRLRPVSFPRPVYCVVPSFQDSGLIPPRGRTRIRSHPSRQSNSAVPR